MQILDFKMHFQLSSRDIFRLKATSIYIYNSTVHNFACQSFFPKKYFLNLVFNSTNEIIIYAVINKVVATITLFYIV